MDYRKTIKDKVLNSRRRVTDVLLQCREFVPWRQRVMCNLSDSVENFYAHEFRVGVSLI